MSYDTTLVILKTKDNFKVEGNKEVKQNKKIDAWRVGVIQAVENIHYFETEENENFLQYLYEVFNTISSKVFYDKRKARKYANELYKKEIQEIEYGTEEYDYSKYSFLSKEEYNSLIKNKKQIKK